MRLDSMQVEKLLDNVTFHLIDGNVLDRRTLVLKSETKWLEDCSHTRFGPSHAKGVSEPRA